MYYKLWEEKNSTEQWRKYVNNLILDQSDITGEIAINSIKNQCDVIGSGKIWKRKCPKCKTIRFYKNRKTYFTTLKRNTICKACSNKQNATGKSPSLETRQRLSAAVSGNKNGHYGLPGTRLGKTLSSQQKLKMSKSQKGRKWSNDFRNKMNIVRNNPEYKEACRLGAIKIMLRERLNGYIHSRSYNKNACKYFNDINIKFGWSLQHANNGGEVECHGYFLDAYDKTKNIVVEYDESRHYTLIDGKWILLHKDIERMNNIKKYLGCKFYRYNEKISELKEY